MARVRAGMDAVPRPLASLQGYMVSPKYHAVFVPSRHSNTGRSEKMITERPCELQAIGSRVTKKDTAGRVL